MLGTDWKLRAYDRDGGELWQQAVTGVAWSETISGDGRKVVAGLDDGTIRWFDMEDGRELLGLFPHVDGERWVAWTFEGFFAALEVGAELMGYHFDRAPGEAPDFMRVEQLFDYFYRPELLIHAWNATKRRSARLWPKIRAAASAGSNIGSTGSVVKTLDSRTEQRVLGEERISHLQPSNSVGVGTRSRPGSGRGTTRCSHHR